MLSTAVEVGDDGGIVAFNWNLIDKCQFKCSYCYATDFNKEDSFSKNLHTSSYKFILAKLDRCNFDWEIDVLGGEPTLHPELPAIINRLEHNTHCRRISLATNFSKGVNYYRQFDVEGSKLELHISYHPEYHKRIQNKLLKLVHQVNHMFVFVEVILYPKRQFYDQMQEFLKFLEDNNIPFGTNLVRDTPFWDCKYDEGFYNTFERWLNMSSTLKTPQQQLVRHVYSDGVVKYATENELIQDNVYYKGFRCQQMMYTIDMAGNFLNTCTGNRLNTVVPKEQDFKQFIVCPQAETCRCSAMLYYKKYKDVNFTEN